MENKSPGPAPVAKVTAATLGGALAAVAVWVLGQYQVQVSPEAAAGLATLFAFVAGYITPPHGF